MASLLPCKLIAQVAFKAGGDVFHEMITQKPHHLPDMTPGQIHGCDVHGGSFGTQGCVIQWKYTLDGKEQTTKHVLQHINDEKKTVSYKVVEGDVMNHYKNMLITVHVETKVGVDFITWTIDYELLTPDSPHLFSIMNFFIEFAKELEKSFSES